MTEPSRSRSNSANTGNAQVDVQNCDSCRSHAWNAGRLTESRRLNFRQLFADLSREARNRSKSEIARDPPPFRMLEALDLPFLLCDVAGVLRFSLYGRQQPADWLFTERLLHPGPDLLDFDLRALEPLTVAMAPQRRK